MSQWDKLQLEDKIVEILTGVRYHKKHHFGRPFLTAYQLAIAFAERYTTEFQQLGYPIGGQGIGQRTSLAQYLAAQLSARIKKGSSTRIEGAFISKGAGIEITSFTQTGKPIRSSLKNTFDLSMFRLKDEQT